MPEQKPFFITIEQLKYLQKNTVMEALDIELVSLDDESITLRMPISDKTRQPLGALHGGVSMVLAESAASVHAAWGVDLSKVVPVGIEISASHLRTATEGTVLALGRVLRRSPRFIVHEVKITLEEDGKLLSLARVTNYYKPHDGSLPNPLEKRP